MREREVQAATERRPEQASEIGGLLTRRRILDLGLRAGALAAAGAFGLSGRPVEAAAPIPPERAASERTLSVFNHHTGESLRQTYWAQGQYVPDALRAIDQLFRDYRSGEVHYIDLRLIDLLHDIHSSFDTQTPLHLISGYRSKTTNDHLAKEGRSVAPRSFHIRGMAADIYVPGYELEEVRAAALLLRRGGVGYYEGQFVHVDLGRLRTW
jgi:uncharacterized protein YcbK (DUF882 family)